jgi:hypothetical protein
VRIQRRLGVLHGHALGDLQLEQAWIGSGLLHDRAHRVEELRLLQLPRGEIDGDAQVGAARFAQAPQVETRLPQDPGPDRHDLAGALGDGDEFVRRQQSSRRMLPAQQRLDAHHLG